MKQIDDITKVPTSELRLRNGAEVVAIYRQSNDLASNDLLVVYKYIGVYGSLPVHLNGVSVGGNEFFDVLHYPPFEFPLGVGEALRYCMDGGAFKTAEGIRLVVVGDYRIANPKSCTLRTERYGLYSCQTLQQLIASVVGYWDEEVSE